MKLSISYISCFIMFPRPFLVDAILLVSMKSCPLLYCKLLCRKTWTRLLGHTAIGLANDIYMLIAEAIL